MKASRFTDSRNTFGSKQIEEGKTVAEVCKEAGISQATCFNWKKKHAGLLLSDMRKLRNLEDENNRPHFRLVGLTPNEYGGPSNGD